MINYFFNYSGRKEYVNIVNFFSKKLIAAPSLLTGDIRLDNEFNLLYPGKVIRQKDIYYELHKIKRTDYKKNYFCNFFTSSEYLIYKDQLLKIMDRVDDLGSFSRLDRESLIYRLTIFWFSKIKLLKPDILVFCASPHTHETYSLYAIGKYLNIPIYLIKEWGAIPCLWVDFVYNKCSKILKRKKFYKSDFIVLTYIRNYLDTIELNKGYNPKKIPIYMLHQKMANVLFGTVISLFLETIRRYKSGYLSKKRIVYRFPVFIFLNTTNFLKSFFYMLFNFFFAKFFEYDPKNPFYFSLLKKKFLIKNRNKILIAKYSLLSEIFSVFQLKSFKYVYFALSYEPEATTIPEGKNFYDQFTAIISLRKWLPKNVEIFIKEHPSQFYINDAKGYLARSQYFYDALKDIPGVRIVSMKLNTYDLIKNSLFVSSINGSISLEAVLLGKKALYFGEAYYSGMPNTFSWKKNLDFTSLIYKKKIKKKDLQLFLVKNYKKYAYPAFLNPSGQYFYHISENNVYRINETIALKDLMKVIFENSKTIKKNIKYS